MKSMESSAAPGRAPRHYSSSCGGRLLPDPVAGTTATTGRLRVVLSDAKYGIPPGISNYGNSECAPFIIALRKLGLYTVYTSSLSFTAIRNPEFDCPLSGASIQVLHDVLGIRNPETGLSLLHRPGERSESGIRNLKSLVQPETKACVGAFRNLESGISLGPTQNQRTRWDC